VENLPEIFQQDFEMKWLDLLEQGKEGERAQVSIEDLEKAARDFVAILQAQLDKEFTVIAVEAQQQADMYWATHRSAREDTKEKKQRIGTRVRLLNNSLVAEWYQNRFVKPEPGGERKRVFSTYLKKGGAFRYPKHYFKKEPQWSQEVIELVENRYVLLRQRANVLAKIRRALAEYERLVDKCYRQPS
jgi:hypothetical protein